eukprot:m.10755 g.10755  ORF g.10755 m.10755 type:complete len:404 (-) comp4314_c0_seq2:118-1329(-)
MKKNSVLLFVCMLLGHCAKTSSVHNGFGPVENRFATNTTVLVAEVTKGVNEKGNNVTLIVRTAMEERVPQDVFITIHLSTSKIVNMASTNLTILANTTQAEATLQNLKVGHVKLEFSTQSEDATFNNATIDDVEVRFVNSLSLVTINAVIGWIYFAAWSASFYPQVFYNFKRKAVTGLNFDYLTYNITGFLGYAAFNVGMFWVSDVQDQYKERHPGSTNPVHPNDVFFTLHAVALTIVTIFQCFIYERGDQKVSLLCKTLTTGSWTFVTISLILVLVGKYSWLNWLNNFAFIKMGVTFIKYIPQAVMNFKRKSTVGWSIGNILLDFTGGMFSMLQMGLQYYNNDDPSIFVGDPVKLALGLISVCFDLIFMTQHYILYPRPKNGKERYINSSLRKDDDDKLLLA